MKQNTIKFNALKLQLFIISLTLGLFPKDLGTSAHLSWAQLTPADPAWYCAFGLLAWELAGLGAGVTQLCWVSPSKHPKVFLVPVEIFQEILWTRTRSLGAWAQNCHSHLYCLFIQFMVFMVFSWLVYWSGLPFPLLMEKVGLKLNKTKIS